MFGLYHKTDSNRQPLVIHPHPELHDMHICTCACFYHVGAIRAVSQCAIDDSPRAI